MFIDFKSAKELVVRRVYEQIYTSDENEYFYPSEIRALCGDKFSTIFVRKIIADLVLEKYLHSYYYEEDNEHGYTITSKGISFAERVLSREAAEEGGMVVIPASDRIVPINHNNPDDQAVIDGVEGAVEAVRQSNTVPEAEKGWIKIQLESGLALIKKARQVTLSAIRSMLLEPLSSALKSVSEDHLKTIIQHAITLLRNWLGY